MTTPNIEELLKRAKRLRNDLDESNARLDQKCVTAMYEMEQALQSQAKRIEELSLQVVSAFGQAQEALEERDALRAELAAMRAIDKNSGLVRDERKPLTQVLSAVREYLPPDGIAAKDFLNKIIAIVDPWPLPAKPLIALKDVEISLMAHNDDPGDWNDQRYRDSWLEGYEAGARATEDAHGIGGV